LVKVVAEEECITFRKYLDLYKGMEAQDEVSTGGDDGHNEEVLVLESQ